MRVEGVGPWLCPVRPTPSHAAGRSSGPRWLFYAEGGHAPMDVICVTPEEFEAAKGRATLVAAVLPEAIALLESEAAPA